MLATTIVVDVWLIDLEQGIDECRAAFAQGGGNGWFGVRALIQCVGGFE